MHEEVHFNVLFSFGLIRARKTFKKINFTPDTLAVFIFLAYSRKFQAELSSS